MTVTNGDKLTGKVYDDAFTGAAKNDGDLDDGKWYGWSYEGVTKDYTVTINVYKDGQPWSGHGRTFALLTNGGGFITGEDQTADSSYSISQVSNGTYRILDITDVPADSFYSKARDTGIDVRVSGTDTEVDVTVQDADAEATVSYYTVTFYDGSVPYESDTPQSPQIVLNGKAAVRPEEDPSKPDYDFAGWKTADGEDGKAYDFDSIVAKTTDIYASWVEKAAEQFHITATAEEGGTIDPIGDTAVTKGGEKTYTITPNEGYQIKAVIVDGSDVTAELADTLARAQAGVRYYTFTNVTQDHTIHATFEPLTEVKDSYTVTVNVKKDKQLWNGHDRTFALLNSEGSGFIIGENPTAESSYSISQVPNGIYRIYDVTGVPEDFLYSQAQDIGMNGMDTTVTVTVNGKDENADVNYYTATFYDGTEAYKADTPQKPQIVLSGQGVLRPDAPGKDDYQFAGWKTENGGSTPYDFTAAVTKTTNIFASWVEKTAEQLHIAATAAKGGSISPAGDIAVTKGGEQTFIITPNEGYRIKAVTVDGSDVTAELADTLVRAQAGARYYTFTNVMENHTIHAAFESDDRDKPDPGDNSKPGGGGNPKPRSGNSTGDIQVTVVSETASAPARNDAASDGTSAGASDQTANETEPKTGDAVHMEVYATIAMIAGLTYLLLYFMEEERGMSEREKEAFVAAFIRWGKKGGAFRRGCAMVAIFCLLVYYHSIGKRAGKNILERKYLGMTS